MRCPKAYSSIDRHMHMIAYESLEKLLSLRVENNCVNEKNWGRDTQLDIVRSSRTLSDSVEHYPVRTDFVQVGVSGEEVKKQTSSDSIQTL
jgi:hypothetical protein